MLPYPSYTIPSPSYHPPSTTQYEQSTLFLSARWQFHSTLVCELNIDWFHPKNPKKLSHPIEFIIHAKSAGPQNPRASTTDNRIELVCGCVCEPVINSTTDNITDLQLNISLPSDRIRNGELADGLGWFVCDSTMWMYSVGMLPTKAFSLLSKYWILIFTEFSLRQSLTSALW